MLENLVGLPNLPRRDPMGQVFFQEKETFLVREQTLQVIETYKVVF